MKKLIKTTAPKTAAGVKKVKPLATKPLVERTSTSASTGAGRRIVN
jgi:hypothetical protein